MGNPNKNTSLMTYNRNLSQWRSQFAEAASALRAERDRVFHSGHLDMITRIRGGGCQALRDLALELREHGVYSRKLAPCTVEQLILSRLHSNDWQQRTWRQFVGDTVGLAWFRPRRTGRRKAQ